MRLRQAPPLSALPAASRACLPGRHRHRSVPRGCAAQRKGAVTRGERPLLGARPRPRRDENALLPLGLEWRSQSGAQAPPALLSPEILAHELELLVNSP